MMPAMCSLSFAVGVIGCARRYSRCATSVAASRANTASSRPSLLPKGYFTSAALTADFCAMSLNDTSIDERPIISSLAATSSFSAVAFLAAGGRGGMSVFNCDPMTCLGGEMRGEITPYRTPTQEIIDRLTKTLNLLYTG